MSLILQTAQNLELTDNFSQWRTKFNFVLGELKATNFVTPDEVVTIETSQTIDGGKTFSATVVCNSGISVNGDAIFSGSFSSTGNSNFIGANGIRLLSTSNVSSFRFNFNSPSEKQNLVLDYEDPLDDAQFTISENVTLNISGSEPKIKVGESTWNLPSTDPSANSLLYWNNINDTIIWKTTDAVATELTDTIADSLLDDNDFRNDIIDITTEAITYASTTLAVNLIPVGSIIEIDATAVDGWTNGGVPDTNFPGWLFLDGSTINKTTNPEFTAIVDLLNPGQNTATLTDSTGGVSVKLIKYLEDPVSTFKLEDGNGIQFSNGTTPLDFINLTSNIATVSLKANSSDFIFNSGELTLASNVAKTIDGKLQSSVTPSLGIDLTNKTYVDAQVSSLNQAAQSIQGSTLTLGENIDSRVYCDGEYSLTFVDRDGVGRSFIFGENFGDGEMFDESFVSISPITLAETKFKKSYTSASAHYFVDNNDIIYGHGKNNLGQIAASSRNKNYYSTGNSIIYGNTTIQNCLPAFLPTVDLWPANAVTVDYVTGNGTVSSISNLTLKTKDGVGNAFVDNISTNGLIEYKHSGVSYSRGYFLSIGDNGFGTFGDGLTTDASATTGPKIWGPIGTQLGNNFPARTLWLNFGVQDSERNAIGNLITNSRNAFFKRFNWFKPNVIDALGLSGWRTQTGVGNDVEFSAFNWFIKKVLRTNNAHYVIVGKPGTELQNEVWCSGGNSTGSFGNGTNVSTTDYSPVLSSPTTVIGPGAGNAGSISLRSGDPTSGSGVFRTTSTQNHGFSNFERLINGSNSYVILTGDQNNQNASTTFRLFSTLANAVNAFISGGVGVNFSASTLATSVFSYRSKLKGVYDLHVGGNLLLMKVALTETPNNTALDSLSESAILTNKVMAVGSNANGFSATNQTISEFYTPLDTIFPPNTAKIIRVFAADKIAVSYALDANGNLWTAGNKAAGLSDVGNISGNLQQWTKTNVSLLHKVLNFHFIDFTSSYYKPKIYIICEKRSGSNPSGILFAGGKNYANSLGIPDFTAETLNYVQIIFPEDPKNIVSFHDIAATQPIVICKTPGQSVGRVYSVGNDVKGYFSTRIYDSRNFRNIDRFIR